MFRQLWKYPFRGPKASIFMPICWRMKIGKSKGREVGREEKRGEEREEGRGRGA